MRPLSIPSGSVATLAAALLATTAPFAPALADPQPDADRRPALKAAIDLFPAFEQHDKRGPLPIMPIYDVTRMPGDWRYKRDEWDPAAVTAPLGAVETVVNTTRPLVAGFGLTDNGAARQAFVDAKQRAGQFMVRGVGTYKWADDYQDGDGNTVRTGYGRDTEQLILGWFPNQDTTLKAIVIRDEIREDKQPNTTTQTPAGPFSSGADSLETERYIGKLVFDTAFDGALEALHAETTVAWIDRRNNNFEMQPPRQPGQRQEANVDRRKVEGLVHGDLRLDTVPVRLGLRGLYDSHDAERSTGSALDTVSSVNYPDITRIETSLFAESALALGGGRLDLGLRWDHASTSPGRADDTATWLNPPGTRAAATTTPRALYRTYHGTTELDRAIHAVSAVAAVSRDWIADADETLDTRLRLGRIARLPDNQELYFARFHGNPQMRAIGDPGLDPEIHYRAEAEATYESAAWQGFGRTAPLADGPSVRLSATASLDYVEDFISRDRAADTALIWRNVDARFVSLSMAAEWNLTRTLSAGLYGRATWAENLDDSRGLYGIAPAEATFLVDYHDRLGTLGTWNAGFKLRAVAAPSDPDDDLATGTALDPEDIGAFAVLDLHAGAQVYDRVGVRLSVTNVLDTDYAELDPHYVTDTPNPGPIDAPGRTFALWTVVNF